MGDPSFLGIKLVDIAIFILWTTVCFSVGRFYGYYEKERDLKKENVR